MTKYPAILFFLFLLFFQTGFSQVNADSITNKITTLFPSIDSSNRSHTAIIEHNSFLNTTSAPEALIIEPKNRDGKELFFYVLTGILMLFGFLKLFYAKYFNSIFRLYFNTSLRQNQLTDLILQARLSSLIFNIFFFISAGVYLYFVLTNMGILKDMNPLLTMGLSVLLVASIYTLKYFGILFIGWLSGMKLAANIYIFVTFLTNKVLGVFLLPFIIIIAFSSQELVRVAILVSLAMVLLLFLSRYLRSYGLLEKDLKISILHFFIYILAIEIIPLLLLYKGLSIGLGYLA